MAMRMAGIGATLPFAMHRSIFRICPLSVIAESHPQGLSRVETRSIAASGNTAAALRRNQGNSMTANRWCRCGVSSALRRAI
jgi:hypothetical protein